MTRITSSPRWLMALGSALALLLSACGGGGGVGSGGTGAMAVGTVDGFGSVYIGGERCDEIGARIVHDTVAGGPEPAQAELKLGQRVEAELDGSGTACKILVARISPELVGTVSATAPLTVAGAQVLVNTDPAVGPVTVFDGYDGAADIAVDDRVEVHGKAVAVGGGVAVRATRIERKPATDTWVRVAGVIQNLNANAQTFTLGALTVHYSAGTTLVPSDLALANGQSVAMWSVGPAAANHVDARFIRLLRRNFPHQSAVRVEGPVSGCTGGPCNAPTIDGIPVLITATTTFTWGSPSDVVNGRTMHVRGSFDANTGQLIATAVAVRLRDPNAGVITLLGTVSEFASAGGETHFRVRGVPVTLDGSTTIAAGCTVDDGRLVGVIGHIVGASVRATAIGCPALAAGTVVDVYAQVTDLDTASRTFRLGGVGPLLSLVTLHYGEITAFHGFASTPLADGQYVALRAVYRGSGDGFLATRVILDDTPPAGPGGGLVFRTVGIAHHIVAGTSLHVGGVTMAVNGGTVIDPSIDAGTVVRAWFYRDVANARWVALLVKPAPLF